ncbi:MULTISPECIES: phospholipid-binding protein MlaC [unclassified Acidisoma]|jgi:phospholipid transport system substrate-binding protein|uniref:MlaC/ttg2D family ABC transporter substrate-binding protein n=1 Tax=unclassified Acidisoma TaxID=2634065 RepID=UPI00131A857B|nr:MULTISPECIES: ABC transporter substrate-binding protein [unclassified Acidisoma]
MTIMAPRRHLLALFTAGVLVLTAPLVARADPTSDAKAMILSTGSALLKVAESNGSASDKQSQLQQLIYTNVDVDAVGRFVLGRYWRIATPKQQQDYMNTFRQLLVYAVTAQASSFQGAQFRVASADQRDLGVVVDTLVNIPGKPEAHVQWVVAPINGRPMIIDILAEGTSLRLTQRNDYAGVISQHSGDIDALIDAMHKQLARFQSQTAG